MKVHYRYYVYNKVNEYVGLKSKSMLVNLTGLIMNVTMLTPLVQNQVVKN